MPSLQPPATSPPEPPGGHVLLDAPPLIRCDHLLAAASAQEALRRLDAELDWQRPRLRLYGREHPIPRRQVWMGDPQAYYRYSGHELSPSPWHPLVTTLRDAVQTRLQAIGWPATFNGVLLNRYADGSERMGWHSDDEPELGHDPLVAAVSLGAERPLRFRWRQREHPAFNVWLPHNSLLFMGPGVQQRLQHALLPRRLPGVRISLTFRWIVPRG